MTDIYILLYVIEVMNPVVNLLNFAIEIKKKRSRFYSLHRLKISREKLPLWKDACFLSLKTYIVVNLLIWDARKNKLYGNQEMVLVRHLITLTLVL